MTAVAEETPADRSRRTGARLEQLVAQYGALIRRVVSRTAGREAAGARDDIEQQVLVNLWRQLDREQVIDHPASYISRAAVREPVRAVRRERSREQPAGDAADLASHVLDEVTPEAALQRKERAAVLTRAIGELQPERGLAVRAHLAGYDVAEIMRMFGWTYHKARNLVARGMADLRARLIEKGIRG
jgi:RNA polymerase sigma factor (sigma-70 family)